MSIIQLIKRTLSRYAEDKSVRDFERVLGMLAAQDNQKPFAADLAAEEKARNEYLDQIGYPKELRDP